MAINYELLNKGGISLGTNFELLSEKPLDSRLVVPSLDGLQNYIDNAAAYEGLIAYVSSEKKHYEVKTIDGVLSYRPFGLTEAELNDIITNATTAAMEFKGATATLPENPSKGDMWKVAGENINIKVDGVDAKLGDSIVYNGEQWFLIPSGDDIEDTWRPVDGVNNNATLKFVDGDKTVAAVTADGTIKYNHATVAAPEDVTAEGDEKTRTYITAVETDGYGHITGYKTATENVEDTNTTYEFEGQAEESSVYFQVTSNEEGASAEVVYLDAYSKNEVNTELAKKVDKVEGYSLVSDDEIARLAEVDNYDDEEVRGLIGDNAQAIEDLETYVGTIPTDEKYKDLSVVGYINKKAEETLAAAQGGSSETAASVKQQLDNYKSENDTRVKAAEDAIDVIEADYLKAADKTELSNAIAGVKATADAAATKEYTDAELAKKVTKTDYEADKATFATKTEISKLAGVSEGANKVEASTTNGSIKIDGVETVIYTHPEKHAIADVTGLQDALDGKQAAGNYSVEGHKHVKDDITDFAHTHIASEITDLDATIKGYDYATKAELGNVDAKFDNYKTAADQKLIDDEQDRRLGVIEGDYLKAADIVNFETKANVKKVADDLAAYVEANDAALAAETKARTDADAGFETRIAALEGNFGDGEGTVEAQIAAAVKAEEDARKTAVKGVQDEVDVLDGRMDSAEGRITALETESAKHAVKTEVEAALALKADKSVVDAMYTNAQIDGFIAEAKKYADDNDADTKYGIVYDSDNKKIKLVEGGTEVEIDATDFIKDGMIETVTIGEDNDLVITFNTAAGKENIVLPLDQLVDIYTGVEGARIKVTVASDKSISADLVAGSISKNYLDDGVQASLAKADSAETNAKAYADGLITTANLSQYAKAADLNTLGGRVDAAEQAIETFEGVVSNVHGLEKDQEILIAEVFGSLSTSGDSRIDALENLADGLREDLGCAEQDIQLVLSLVQGVDTVEGSVANKIKGAIDGLTANLMGQGDSDIVVAEAQTAIADGQGNNIADTYETKEDSSDKLDEAKKHAENMVTNLEERLDGTLDALIVAVAEKATCDLDGNVITETYAQKATTLAGYGIGDAYTKAEVEALLTWGEF